MSITYKISGITCSGCQAKVEHLFSAIDGVENVSVDLATGNTEVTFTDQPIATAVFKEALKPYPKYQIMNEPEQQTGSWLHTIFQKIGIAK